MHDIRSSKLGGWQGYQGAQTLLREVTLDAELGALLMNPLPEMAQLRGDVLFSGPADGLQYANATQVCGDASLHPYTPTSSPPGPYNGSQQGGQRPRSLPWPHRSQPQAMIGCSTCWCRAAAGPPAPQGMEAGRTGRCCPDQSAPWRQRGSVCCRSITPCMHHSRCGLVAPCCMMLRAAMQPT